MFIFDVLYIVRYLWIGIVRNELSSFLIYYCFIFDIVRFYYICLILEIVLFCYKNGFSYFYIFFNYDSNIFDYLFFIDNVGIVIWDFIFVVFDPNLGDGFYNSGITVPVDVLNTKKSLYH